MCKVFKVMKSSYYEWLRSGPSARWQENEKLLTEIMDIFEASHGTYGSPRISKELRVKGWTVSLNRVAKMMRAAGIRVRKPKRFVVTTNSKHNYPVVPNVLGRKFRATKPGQIWISDITYSVPGLRRYYVPPWHELIWNMHLFASMPGCAGIWAWATVTHRVLMRWWNSLTKGSETNSLSQDASQG